MILLASVSIAWQSTAQILQGEWVDQSEAAIEQHRKTDVTVIVLDQKDQAIKGAKVQLKLERHDFTVGLTLPIDQVPPEDARSLPVYRCINAIALDRFTDWSRKKEIGLKVQAQRLAGWVKALEPTHTHYGPVLSADPAQNHDGISLLGAAELRDAVLSRIDRATSYSPAPDSYDLYADVLKQDMIERKLGYGMLSRMFDHADAGRPQARYGVRVRNAISLQSGRTLANRIQKLEVRQVPLDHITIEQQFRDQVQAGSLRRMLEEYVAPMPVPVTLAGIEVGGRTPVAASINMETVLRLVFAQPRITGIYFAGLIDKDLLEENSALIDGQGEPTVAGNVLDAMFTKLWTSDETGQTDERGNMQTRVFTGWYSATATLPNGSKIESKVYIPASDRAKIVVLQATAAE